MEAKLNASSGLPIADGVFRLLVEQAQDYAIFLLDPEGHIASWNDGAARIKQYKASEIVGKHFSIFYAPEDIKRDWPKTELARALIDGRYEDTGWRLRKKRRLAVLGERRHYGVEKSVRRAHRLLQDHPRFD